MLKVRDEIQFQVSLAESPCFNPRKTAGSALILKGLWCVSVFIMTLFIYSNYIYIYTASLSPSIYATPMKLFISLFYKVASTHG